MANIIPSKQNFCNSWTARNENGISASVTLSNPLKCSQAWKAFKGSTFYCFALKPYCQTLNKQSQKHSHNCPQFLTPPIYFVVVVVCLGGWVGGLFSSPCSPLERNGLKPWFLILYHVKPWCNFSLFLLFFFFTPPIKLSLFSEKLFLILPQLPNTLPEEKGNPI